MQTLFKSLEHGVEMSGILGAMFRDRLFRAMQFHSGGVVVTMFPHNII